MSRSTFSHPLSLALILLAGCSLDDDRAGAEPPADSDTGPTNRLARETSPYLLLHARNPVDWYPWGPEALDKARREEKLIFLSIGYSSCHWCHVMEREVFSNPEIARSMNEHFVNVKVDREERPDIDEIYMTALQVYYQALGVKQAGGWPLSMFLTPDGRPLGGGTYFPPEDRDGRDGFPTLMKRVVEAWSDNRQQMEKNAEVLAAGVRSALRTRPVLKAVRLESGLVTAAVQSLQETFDPEYGGFDYDPAEPQRPKFPVPAKLALLQSEFDRRDDPQVGEMLARTLERMAAGGIHDQVGGGFHRYSTDRFWRVPHFEKMLYDNAQLADVYLEAWRQTGDPQYRTVAEGVLSFVLREMTDPQGGFYSALGADSDGGEGTYYVWTREEIERLLSPEEFLLAEQVFGLDRPANFEKAYVLEIVRPIPEVAEQRNESREELDRQLGEIRRKLLKARAERSPPMRDDKVLTSWNGLMIGTLARAGRLLENPDYTRAGERAALFILSRMRDEDGRLLRTSRAGQAKLKGYLDDYAFLVHGLLELHETTGEAKWLNAACRLTDRQRELFWDERGRAYFFTANDHEQLLVRTKDIYDSVLPAGNSVTVRNLVRLASLTGESRYRDDARQTLEALAPQLEENPRGLTYLALALGEYLHQTASAPNAEEPPGDKPSDRTGRKLPEHVRGTVSLATDRLRAGSTTEFVLRLTIEEPWHINANPATDEFAIPTELDVASTHGTEISDVRYPPPEKQVIPGLPRPLLLYSGEVVIRGTLRVPAEAAGQEEELVFQVNYQACSDTRCLRPQVLTLTVPVEVR